MTNQHSNEETRECLFLMGPFDCMTRPVTRVWRGNGLITQIDETSENGLQTIRYVPRFVDCQCGNENIVFVFKGAWPFSGGRPKGSRNVTRRKK